MLQAKGLTTLPECFPSCAVPECPTHDCSISHPPSHTFELPRTVVKDHQHLFSRSDSDCVTQSEHAATSTPARPARRALSLNLSLHSADSLLSQYHLTSLFPAWQCLQCGALHHQSGGRLSGRHTLADPHPERRCGSLVHLHSCHPHRCSHTLPACPTAHARNHGAHIREMWFLKKSRSFSGPFLKDCLPSQEHASCARVPVLGCWLVSAGLARARMWSFSS